MTFSAERGPGASTKGSYPTAPSPSCLEEAKRELLIRQAEGLGSVGVLYFWPIEAKAGAEQRFLQSRTRPQRIQAKGGHFCRAELGIACDCSGSDK